MAAQRSAGGPNRRPDRRSAGARPRTRRATPERRNRDSRPAAGKKTVGGTAKPQVSKRRAVEPVKGRLTRRAAVLAAIVAVLVLSLAYPAKQYLAQRAQIAKNQHEQAAQEERIRALRERKSRWSDPGYIREQARDRLQYVEPGELTYIVEGGKTSDATGSGEGSKTRPGSRKPWYDQLWSDMKSKDSERP